MLKKRVLFLFFIIFSWNISSEVVISQMTSSILQESYDSSPDNLFMEGKLQVGETSYPIIYYREKNRENYFNISVKIDNELTRYKQNKDETLTSGTQSFYTTEIPIEILDYPLRSREYTVLERSNLYEFKGISCNKILVLHTNRVIEEEKKEEGLDSIDPLDAYIMSTTNLNDEFTLETEPEPEPLPVIIPDYEKLIFTVSEMSDLVMEVQFYKAKKDREPAYIYEAVNLHFIDGFYTVTSWRIRDVKKDITIQVNLNQETLTHDRMKVNPKHRNMISFYGVR